MQWDITQPQGKMLPFDTTWMNINSTKLNEISQSDKESEVPYDFTHK